MRTNLMMIITAVFLAVFSCFTASATDGKAIKVTFTGKQPKITDFVNAYATSLAPLDEYEAVAVAKIQKGNRPAKGAYSKSTIVDLKNGFCSYFDAGDPGTLIEMCYWNCADGQSKLLAVNHVEGIGTSESGGIRFFRYDIASHTMQEIETPFNHTPLPTEFIKAQITPQKDANEYLNSLGIIDESEDTSSLVTYRLPKTGKDITIRFCEDADIPAKYRVAMFFKWNGDGFTLTTKK